MFHKPAFIPTLRLAHRPRLRRRTTICSADRRYHLADGEIPVRFINTPSGSDVVAAARPGDQLLTVSDSVGVCIPRACRSGLCGSCTCDIKDPSFEGGVQTVRACQTSVVLPPDSAELVVDVERMKQFKGRRSDPMARFENLDTDYVAGAPPRQRGSSMVQVSCTTCASTGSVECYSCDGTGLLQVEEGPSYVCPLCAGAKVLRCADCQGSGVRLVKR